MLIHCPECVSSVSDKAVICPKCGCPVRSVRPSSPYTSHDRNHKTHRPLRLPNGFGHITEIKGRKLRNPFRVTITVGKRPDGKPICKQLSPRAYFPTYNEAYAALADYNRDPKDLEPAITVIQLYKKWSESYFKTLKREASAKAIQNAWKFCSEVYDMKVSDIRAGHIKECVENGMLIKNGEIQKPNAHMKNKIKSIFNLMLDYAVEFDIVAQNYSRAFRLSNDTIKEIQTVKNEHIPFSTEEMELLWDSVDHEMYADILLIQCYSGWRPQELGLIELKDVDLKRRLIRGGIKTKAGTDRIVPIHSKIFHLVEQRYREAESLKSLYLFNYTNPNRLKETTKFTYARYRDVFNELRDRLKLDPAHRPHDARMHFVTMAKRYGVDEYAIKKIIGHQINDLTEKVYTRRTPDWLRREIEKIM